MDSRLRYKLENGETRPQAKRRSTRRPAHNRACPFCGSLKLWFSDNLDADAGDNSIHCIECENCKAGGPWVTGSEARSWRFWNRRQAAPEELSIEKRILFPKPEEVDLEKRRKAKTLAKLEPTLRPCPFCSSKKVILLDLATKEEVWFVNCQNCFAGGPYPLDGENTPKIAADEWNGSLLNGQLPPKTPGF